MKPYCVRINLISVLLSAILCSTLSGCRTQEVIWEDGQQSHLNGTSVSSSRSDEQSDEDTLVLTEKETAASIRVYVCGKVMYPGVYTLQEGDRVVDALNMAGGMSPDADAQALNLARMLMDEEQIIVYSVEEISELNASGAGGSDACAQSYGDVNSAAEADGRVNLNTADAEELMSLPGIGQSRAEAIIAWRQENGAFGSIEDIMLISGIKGAIFSQIKDKIRV